MIDLNIFHALASFSILSSHVLLLTNLNSVWITKTAIGQEFKCEFIIFRTIWIKFTFRFGFRFIFVSNWISGSLKFYMRWSKLHYIERQAVAVVVVVVNLVWKCICISCWIDSSSSSFFHNFENQSHNSDSVARITTVCLENNKSVVYTATVRVNGNRNLKIGIFCTQWYEWVC